MDIAQIRSGPVGRALSPLNFSELISPDRRRESEIRRPAIECWKCPECFDTHDDEQDAIECCAVAVPSHPDAGDEACPICRHKCEDIHDAANCCLWKDFDVMARFKIATAVEGGASWVDAIAAAAK